MNNIELLLVEDDLEEIENFKTFTETFIKRNPNSNFKLTTVTSVESAKEELQKNSNFDGAIIDLRLDSTGTAGNDVIKEIQNSYRIPIAVLTGTPGGISDDINKDLLKVFTRDDDLNLLLEHIANIYKTGLTKIMGGRGEIETTINNVYLKNILPQLESWTSYAKQNIDTEKALLRHIISHLTELLSESDTHFREEVYIKPPLSHDIKTGSIISEIDTKRNFIVLSPGCDLELRNAGTINTDKILICEIEAKTNNDLGTNKGRIKDTVENKRGYHHWLPETSIFPGGCINFRYIKSICLEELKHNFTEPHTKVSHQFIKDISARFSAYYARQGQPDFDFSKVIDEIHLNNSSDT